MRQGMQTLTQAVTAWGNRPLLAPWVLVGLARVWKWRSNSWETEVNICLCSLAISHKNSFCGRTLSDQTVANARYKLQCSPGKGGLVSSWDQLPASGLGLPQWAGHPPAPAAACRHALKTILTEGPGRGQWPLPALSFHSCLQGLWGQCRTIITTKLPANWGAAASLVVPVTSSVDTWSLKCCTGITGFTFSCFQIWHLQAEKQSESNVPHPPADGSGILWTEYSRPHPLHTLSGWGLVAGTNHVWKFCPLLKAAAEKCHHSPH